MKDTTFIFIRFIFIFHYYYYFYAKNRFLRESFCITSLTLFSLFFDLKLFFLLLLWLLLR